MGITEDSAPLIVWDYFENYFNDINMVRPGGTVEVLSSCKWTSLGCFYSIPS